jgi:Na+/H+ antiporter NhaD/arsenite permease-like protein
MLTTLGSHPRRVRNISAGPMISTSLIVSCLIFFLIAMRQWLPAGVRIWHIMVAGAVVLLLLGEISLRAAFKAVEWNVIAYLFGVFAIAAALYDSGISHAVGHRIAALRSPNLALFILIIATAVCAAVLTNDAAAVIGTPIVLMLANALRLSPIPLLIALCATVTVGSMVSPVGNPQNILIATRGHFENPVATFGLWLVVPTVASLIFVFAWSRHLLDKAARLAPNGIKDLPDPATHARTWPAYLATALLIFLVGVDSILKGLGDGLDLPFGVASLIACSPIFILGNSRIRTVRKVDWQTLTFFVAMFVVTGSLLQSGSLQALLGDTQAQLNELPVTASISFWASQLFSNVPVVDIYLKLLADGTTPNLMMLAGVSTLAGNLFIISAASNVIVVQQAERFGQTPFTFWQFSLGVVPITIVSVALTYGWIAWMAGLL